MVEEGVKMKEGPTILLKTKDSEIRFLEGPTIFIKTKLVIT
jgi:hypothetical protein